MRDGEVCRLGIIASHPVQYFTPLYKRLAAVPGLDVEVLFCRDYGVREQFDRHFSRNVVWDTDQLTGYRYRFLRSVSPISDTFNPLHAINPGVFSRALKSFDAILVNGYMYPSNWLAGMGAALSRTPVLMRSELRLGGRSPRRWDWIRNRIISLWIRRSAALLYIGEDNRRAYLSYGADPAKMFFSPYSTDADQFGLIDRQDHVKVASIREQLRLPPDRIVVLFVGKLVPWKHPESLLQLALTSPVREKLHIVFAGTGSEEAALRSDARRRNAQNVSFLGFVNQSQLPNLYLAADIFVLPSSVEPWGVVLNEAMASGLAAVVSDAVGAAADLIRPGETGLLFRSGDWDEMQRHVAALASEPSLRERIGQAGRELAKRYSYDATVEGILAALRWLGRLDADAVVRDESQAALRLWMRTAGAE